MNFKDRDSFINAYAQTILDGMDNKSMEQFVYDILVENLTDYTNEQLATEIVENYGDDWFTENSIEVNEVVQSVCRLQGWHTTLPNDPRTCYNKKTNKQRQMTCTITKTLTFIEETDLLAMAYSSVAYMKLYAEQSTDNKDYWMMRAEQFERVANKLNTEMRQNMEAN